jgi:hypothetical protein
VKQEKPGVDHGDSRPLSGHFLRTKTWLSPTAGFPRKAANTTSLASVHFDTEKFQYGAKPWTDSFLGALASLILKEFRWLSESELKMPSHAKGFRARPWTFVDSVERGKMKGTFLFVSLALLTVFCQSRELRAQTPSEADADSMAKFQPETQRQSDRVIAPQVQPLRAGKKGNRFVHIVAWPVRTYYNETRDTFRDIVHGKDPMYRVEAIILFAATMFDVATTIDAQKRDPTGREANPVARLLIGTHPHGARPYIAYFFVTTTLLDMAHYLQKDEDERSFYYNAAFGIIWVTSLGHIVSGAYNLSTARCLTNLSCKATHSAGSRDLQEARSRIMSAVPLDPSQRPTPLGNLQRGSIPPH